MLSVATIKDEVKEEMTRFEKHFRKSMKTSIPLLDKIMQYIIKRKGKQMRPMFVFLTAKACGGIEESTYNAAALIELLHTATLVHDDVVDDANERRGFFSINALWKNKIAVLIGDYLLSRGLLMSVENEEFTLLKIVSTAVKEMSEGELLQIEKARKLDITEEVYFDIISKKTASLIASCCAAGAASTGKSDEEVEQMRLFGEKVGLAFQIKDDLFDYGLGVKIGKPTGIDIKERKMTLPLIYALNNADKKDKRRVINLVKKHYNNPQKVKEVIDFVLKSGGIEYTQEVMLRIKDEAIAIGENLAPSSAKDALLGLVEYSISRKK